MEKKDETKFPRDAAFAAPTERPERYLPEPEPGHRRVPPSPQIPPQLNWPPWFPHIG